MTVEEIKKHKGEIVALIDQSGRPIYGYLFDINEEYIVLDKPVMLKFKESVGFHDQIGVVSGAVDVIAELITSASEKNSNVRMAKEAQIGQFRQSVYQLAQQAARPIPYNYAPIVADIENDGMAAKNIVYFPRNQYAIVFHEYLLLQSPENEDNKKAVEELRNVIEDTYSPKKLEEFKKYLEKVQSEFQSVEASIDSAPSTDVKEALENVVKANKPKESDA